MTQELASYIKRESTVNGLTNTLFNGVIAWLLLKNGADLVWWGEHSFVVDILATAFLLPFIVALIVIPLQRRKVAKEKLAPFSPDTGKALEAYVQRFPYSLFKASILFGCAGLVFVAPTTLAIMAVVGVESFSPLHYSIFKGVWAGVVAALLVGPMILVGARAPATSATQ